MNNIEVFCDGGARGNPGPAAYGCVIGNVEISGYLGHATNNQAEYQAVIHALEWIKNNFKGPALWQGGQIPNVKFYLDSQLIVEQLNGRYRVKNEGLAPLYWQARDLIVELGGRVVFQHIPRLQNKKADALVNKILDAQK